MPHDDTLPATATIDADKVDPYLVTGRETAEPPERMGGRFRFLGPCMITSSAVSGYDDVPPRLGRRGWMS